MKILVLTATAGNGHISTAQNIIAKLKQLDPSVEIMCADIFKDYANKLTAWIANDGYFIAASQLTCGYNFFFRRYMRLNPKDKYKARANKSSYGVLYGLMQDIACFAPDVIISTYFVASIAVENLSRVYPINAKLISMTLDYGISPFWECCSDTVDYMYLTADYMVNPFIEKGFSPDSLIVSGIPVSDKFYSSYNKFQIKKDLGLDQNLFTIVVMKASFFPLSCSRLVKEFSKVKTPVQIVFINGHAKRHKTKLDKLSKKVNHKIINLGYTDKVSDYLACSDVIVGKGGGLSCTEAIAVGVPLLIVNKLAEQERLNKNYLVDKGCAICFNKRTLGKKINEFISNPELRQKLTDSTVAMRTPNALSEICYRALNCPQLNLQPYKLSDNKKTLLKKVHKARKAKIKSYKNT